eukprot:GEMP01083545.1.p1 GENE.GEMP01083545.1~~GEMP01083545.1.p1  ORF type:complete len:113 (+),score=2.08 GEMP01083545.1:186-524(+)
MPSIQYSIFGFPSYTQYLPIYWLIWGNPFPIPTPNIVKPNIYWVPTLVLSALSTGWHPALRVLLVESALGAQVDRRSGKTDSQRGFRAFTMASSAQRNTHSRGATVQPSLKR